MSSKLSLLENQVNSLLEENNSISTISTILLKPSKSIYNTIQRIKKKKSNSLLLETPKTPRVSKITKRVKRVINRDLTRSPKKTNKRLLYENNLNITTRSLQRVLKEEEYSINTAKKKQLLNDFKARNRLLYAKETLKNIKNINFNKIVFSDESAIQRGHGSRTEYYRKRRNNRVGKELVSTGNRGTFKNIPNKLK
jgi:transposase